MVAGAVPAVAGGPAVPAVAEAEATAASRALVAQYPKEYPAAGVRLVSLKERMTAPYKDALFVLFAAASLLALIAAAN